MDIMEVLSMTISQAEKNTESRKDGATSSATDRFYEAWKEDAEALRAKRAERLRKESNLGIRFSRRTFDSFDASKDRDAYQKCLNYADHYNDSERNCLLIVGGYGTGKTHLAASIANRLMDNGIPVLFDTFSGHLNKLKLEFNGGKSVYLEQMKQTDMLILDDIGKEKQSEWSQSIMFDVINHRYEHMLPIVMTTNLNSEGLKDYLGGAVWSRLCEMCSGVQTKGSDYRQNADQT